MSVPVKISATINPLMNGAVTGTGTVNSGDSVTLTAIPSSPQKFFRRWILPNNTFSTNNPLTFTAGSVNANYVANFENYLHVVVNQTGGGSVTGQSYQVKAGDTITLVATPTSGFSFNGYYVNGVLLSMLTTYSFVASTDVTITPIFTNTVSVTSPITAQPVLTQLAPATAVTASWVELGEIKTSGVRKAVFYVDVVHNASTNVRVRFLAKNTSGGTGYSFVTLTPTAGVEAVDAQYFELNTDATQSVMLELDLNEEVAFLGVSIEAGTVGATADTVLIKYHTGQ